MQKRGMEQMMLAKGFLSVRLTAKMAGTTIFSVYRWIKEGKLKTIYSTGQMYVARESLVEFIGQDAAKLLGMV